MPRAKKKKPAPKQTIRRKKKAVPAPEAPPASPDTAASAPTPAPEPHPGGRPSLFTKVRCARIIKSVKLGLPLVHAAASARITYRTLRWWMAQGEADEAAGLETEFVQFLHEMRVAEVTPMVEDLETMRLASQKDRSWQAAATRLKMRYPRHMGRSVIEHDLTDAEAKRLLADALGISEEALPPAETTRS